MPEHERAAKTVRPPLDSPAGRPWRAPSVAPRPDRSLLGGAPRVLRLQREAGNAAVAAAIRRAGVGAVPHVSREVEEEIRRARGGGRSLDPGPRSTMENLLGVDLGEVRLHTDARADALSRNLGARAFTVGRDVFFRHGEHGPGGTPANELLAHELAHVVQQGGQAPDGRLTVGPADDDFEREAAAVAREATSGRSDPTSPDATAAGEPPSAQRQPEIDEEEERRLAALGGRGA